MALFSDKQILVTGGNGAVGCHLVNRLLKLGARVTVIDDFSQSTKGNLQEKSLQLVKGDITDPKIVKKAFSGNFHTVFHLAARFANEMSVMNPYEDLRVNVEGTLRVLLASAKQGVKRFVYASSSSLYGQANPILKKETTMPKPSTPYAASKLSGELYCNAIHELYSMDYTIVRLSNSYGPFDPPGKFRNVIPNFIRAALDNRDLKITGTGNETRDFTYVNDVVDGIILAATKPSGRNEIFNLGTGKETKISFIAKQIIKHTNSRSKIAFSSRRSFDHITRRKMDISKTKRLLGYHPKTSISDGLKKTCEWTIQNR